MSLSLSFSMYVYIYICIYSPVSPSGKRTPCEVLSVLQTGRSESSGESEIEMQQSKRTNHKTIN